MMDEETAIAQGLHVTNDSAGYDAACKRILSEKAILARIMKACLEEYKDCDVNDIAEKYIEAVRQRPHGGEVFRRWLPDRRLPSRRR